MNGGEIDWIDFRGLFDTIESYDGSRLHQEVLAPWINDHGDFARAFLLGLEKRPGNPIPLASFAERQILYALSRVIDGLLMSFQLSEPPQAGQHVSLDEYISFVTAMGLHVVRETTFSPFFHEIVAVRPDTDVRAPITVSGEYWPTVMLGDMMISRSGVTVSGGQAFIRKEIAETSTMYWAFRRGNRPCTDESKGWGSNSQWDTAFRRDYRRGRDLYFNVDGRNDLSVAPATPDRDGLAHFERLELLLHRCFIATQNVRSDCWPYEDYFSIVESA